MLIGKGVIQNQNVYCSTTRANKYHFTYVNTKVTLSSVKVETFSSSFLIQRHEVGQAFCPDY